MDEALEPLIRPRIATTAVMAFVMLGGCTEPHYPLGPGGMRLGPALVPSPVETKVCVEQWGLRTAPDDWLFQKCIEQTRMEESARQELHMPSLEDELAHNSTPAPLAATTSYYECGFGACHFQYVLTQAAATSHVETEQEKRVPIYAELAKHKWQRIEAANGESAAIDTDSIRGNGPVLIYMYSPGATDLDWSRFENLILDCAGHAVIVGEFPTSRFDAPPDSVAGKIASIVCKGKGP